MLSRSVIVGLDPTIFYCKIASASPRNDEARVISINDVIARSNATKQSNLALNSARAVTGAKRFNFFACGKVKVARN